MVGETELHLARVRCNRETALRGAGGGGSVQGSRSGQCSQRPKREPGYAKAIGEPREKTGRAYEEVQRPEELELGRWGWWGERNPLGQPCWEL